MKRLILALAFVGGLAGLSPARADIATVSVSYDAGWNMVGGPVGTVLSGASIVETWSSGQYAAVPVTITQPCQGFWAYFPAPGTVALPPAVGPTQSCALQTGWNLVGNPFSGEALLPTGTTAWYWNPSRGAYDTVTSIPPGGSVWVIADSASTIILTFAPAPPPHTPGITEIDLLPTGPVTVHVGDSIKLNLPISPLERATFDPTYLHLDTAGESGDLSCLGDPSCAGSILSQFWIWHAISTGTTSITVAPVCVSAGTCAVPPSVIAVTVLP